MHDKFVSGISSNNTRLAFNIIKNSLNRAIFCSVFFLVFSFSCPSGNSSSDTLSANLEVPEEDETIIVKVDSERWENRYDVFISEDFRL